MIWKKAKDVGLYDPNAKNKDAMVRIEESKLNELKEERDLGRRIYNAAMEESEEYKKNFYGLQKAYNQQGKENAKLREALDVAKKILVSAHIIAEKPLSINAHDALSKISEIMGENDKP